ncbi:hypothetical protein [Priestia megaterium]|uniref:hypothetical protein n=1 Tax=Priestia megaterium TaxID=1404 RepID=UPI003457CC2F
MMKKLTEAFKGKSEMDKNQEELNLVNGTIAELNEKLGKYEVMLQGAQLELEIEEDASTKKRIKKLESGIAKITAQIAEHQKRSDELNQAIAEEQKQQRKALVDEAKKKVEQDVHFAHRASLISREIERVLSRYNTVNGLVEPTALKDIEGVRHGENLDSNNPAHIDLIEANEEAHRVGQEKAQKDAEKVIQLLNDFINR